MPRSRAHVMIGEREARSRAGVCPAGDDHGTLACASGAGAGGPAEAAEAKRYIRYTNLRAAGPAEAAEARSNGPGAGADAVAIAGAGGGGGGGGGGGAGGWSVGRYCHESVAAAAPERCFSL